ncbi:MAG: DUF87 domain-containing protein, partial [Candidatus Hadarchaeum sp.]
WKGIQVNPRDPSKLLMPPYILRRLHRMTTAQEFASFWRLPIPLEAPVPGVPTEPRVRIGKGQDSLPVILGSEQETAGRLDGRELSFDLSSMATHTLIIGTSGSGKTTTVFHLLYQLWETYRIPFLVLEPAKTEYRNLKALWQDDMRVFTLGNELVSPFRFNPFEVPEGVLLEAHISRLNACFVGAFNLFDPLPMLVDKAIRQAYREAGWSEYAVGGGRGAGRVVTLKAMYEQAQNLAEGYAGEVKANIQAALNNRLESLARGAKGRMLNTSVGIPIAELIERPTVLELDLLNAEEKALLMMFILTTLYEYVKATDFKYRRELELKEAQAKDGRELIWVKAHQRLRHVLVVEEAHNLIGRGGPASADRANPREHAINLFTNMLAEMRALREGIIIADQLPSALAPQAMKNTNIKILHQLTAGDDREAIWLTMGAGDRQKREAYSEETVKLGQGEVYVFMQGWREARRGRVIPRNVKEVKDGMVTDDQLRCLPYRQCSLLCLNCDPYVREKGEEFIGSDLQPGYMCSTLIQLAMQGLPQELQEHPVTEFCLMVHFLNGPKFEELTRACAAAARTHCTCHNSKEDPFWLKLYKLSAENRQLVPVINRVVRILNEGGDLCVHFCSEAAGVADNELSLQEFVQAWGLPVITRGTQAFVERLAVVCSSLRRRYSTSCDQESMCRELAHQLEEALQEGKNLLGRVTSLLEKWLSSNLD